MGYTWVCHIATGDYPTASAALEIKGNLSAEVVARSTSFTWTQMASCTSGSFMFASQPNELRAAADLALDSTVACSSDNASKDTTVDATADATANSGQNSSVDSGDNSGADSGDNLSADSGDDAAAYSPDNYSYNAGDDVIEYTIKNNYN